MANTDAVSTFLSLRARAHGLSDAATPKDHAGIATGRDPQAERAQLKALAQEFEAMLMNEMLSGWRRSLMSDDDDNAAGFMQGGLGTMTDLVSTELGRALSGSGGLGIAVELLRAFDRQVASEAPATPHAEAPLAAAGPKAASAPISSGFGWRSDPFTGKSTFHAGVDVRMAYGQSVTSMAAGQVSFAGEQGGYGLTVVVDHSDGLQTRYAHLSSIDVQTGDTVGRGQQLARSGSSGRSTGPHVHVELLRQGRPVDPTGLLEKAAVGHSGAQVMRPDADSVS